MTELAREGDSGVKEVCWPIVHFSHGREMAQEYPGGASCGMVYGIGAIPALPHIAHFVPTDMTELAREGDSGVKEVCWPGPLVADEAGSS